MSSIYQPEEDSYLMSETLTKELPKILKQNHELTFLEIGCGSGINLETAKAAGVKNIFGSDINVEAVKHCKKLGFKCVKSDLFENIKGKFDAIVFNPPYLPLDKAEPKSSRLNTTAGKKGNELIIKFLKQARSYLNKNGKIFLITSSLSKEVDFGKLGFRAKEVSSKKLFFEELFLFLLTIA